MASESRRKPTARLFATTRVNRRVCSAVAPILKDSPSSRGPVHAVYLLSVVAFAPLFKLVPIPFEEPKNPRCPQVDLASPRSAAAPAPSLQELRLRVEVAKSNRRHNINSAPFRKVYADNRAASPSAAAGAVDAAAASIEVVTLDSPSSSRGGGRRGGRRGHRPSRWLPWPHLRPVVRKSRLPRRGPSSGGGDPGPSGLDGFARPSLG